jgi:hypothetical protein
MNSHADAAFALVLGASEDLRDGILVRERLPSRGRLRLEDGRRTPCFADTTDQASRCSLGAALVQAGETTRRSRPWVERDVVRRRDGRALGLLFLFELCRKVTPRPLAWVLGRLLLERRGEGAAAQEREKFCIRSPIPPEPLRRQEDKCASEDEASGRPASRGRAAG